MVLLDYTDGDEDDTDGGDDNDDESLFGGKSNFVMKLEPGVIEGWGEL